jgi:hypothetical protein
MRQRPKFGGFGDLAAGICAILECGMAIKRMKESKFHLLQEMKNIKEGERTRVSV